MDKFLDRHADKIVGTLSCLDRVIITGTIPGICFDDGLTSYLKSQGIRIFDFAQWANPLRERVRANAEAIAADSGVPIKHLSSSKDRKEDLVVKALKQRGHEQPGMVAILSAMESCMSFRPWHDKKTHKTSLRYKQGKCLHYYFYFIHETLGLCYLRVPTWVPFRLQFYCNGHNWLAKRLSAEGIEYTMLDNAFVACADWQQAQRISDSLRAEDLHALLDPLARHMCSVVADFPQGVHWSLMQVEYATDLIFRRQSELAPLYENISRTAIHSVKAENVSTFLGRKLTGGYRDEVGNNFHTRIEGTCIKHRMGKVGIKMYDKHQLVLRVETTANDVRFFKMWREVHRRDGTREMKMAVMRKHLYSLDPLRELLLAANCRYLDFVAAIDDPGAGLKDLDRLSRPARKKNRSLRGFNLFHGEDISILRAIVDGAHCISGFRHKDLARRFPHKSAGQISYLLKRLRTHGLIKKVGNTYKYYVTGLGNRVAMLGLELKEMVIIPALAKRSESLA
jgi:hypothetical protein